MAQVNFTIGAKDNTGAAFKGLNDKLGSLGSTTKAFTALFAAEKIKAFFTDAFKSASEADKGMGASVTKLGDLYRGFQLEIARVVLDNKELMDTLVRLGTEAAPIVVKAFAFIVVTIQKLVNIVQIAINGFKMLWRGLKGDSEIDDLIAANSKLADQVFTIEDYTTAMGKVPSVIHPVAEAAKKATKEVTLLEEALKLNLDDTSLTTIAFKRDLAFRLKSGEISQRQAREEYDKFLEFQKAKEKADKDNLTAMDAVDKKVTDRIRTQAGLDPKKKMDIPPLVIDTAAIIRDTKTTDMDDALRNKAAELQVGIEENFGPALQNGFASIFQGNSIGDVIRGFFSNIVGAIAGGVGQMILTWVKGTSTFASIQAGFYMVYGKIMTALGKLLSNPFTAGFAAVGIGAALYGLTRSLGGQARGSSGMSPSIGGFTGTQSNNLNGISKDGQGTATIVIQGGLLNMNDPNQARQLQRAIQDLSGRRVVLAGA